MTQAPTPGPLSGDDWRRTAIPLGQLVQVDMTDQAHICTVTGVPTRWRFIDAPTAPVEASGQDDDLKLIIAHTIIEDLRAQHPGIEQIDNERGDIWLPGGSTPQSSGCIVDIHSVAQSVEQQVLAALRPGHTDLMVSPESIDALLEANPPPVEASGSERVSDAIRAKYEKVKATTYRAGTPAERMKEGKLDGLNTALAVAMVVEDRLEALRPQPSGETREADAGREAIRKVIHELWQLLDDGETGADGTVTIDQERYQEVSKAMDELEALVPDSAGPFWGGFPVNYFWGLK